MRLSEPLTESSSDYDTDLNAAVKRFEAGDVAGAANMLGVLYHASSQPRQREQIDDVVDQMLQYLNRKERKAFEFELALGMEGMTKQAFDREVREAAFRDARDNRLGWILVVQLVALAIAFIADMVLKLFARLARRDVKFSARQWVYHFFA